MNGVKIPEFIFDFAFKENISFKTSGNIRGDCRIRVQK